MHLNEKNIFLVDGMGALLSALLTGGVLPFFTQWIGLDIQALYTLGLIAFVFSVYSFSCYFFLKNFRRIFLFTIIRANLAYALAVLYLVVFSSRLLIWGKVYFTAELFVLAAVVYLEVRVLRTATRKTTA